MTKMSSLSSCIYKCDAISMKIPEDFLFVKIGQLILKLIWNAKTQQNKNNFGNNSKVIKVWGLISRCFKSTISRQCNINIRDSLIAQWNKKESSEYTHTYI